MGMVLSCLGCLLGGQEPPPVLHGSLRPNAYYHHKAGFRTAQQAAEHAHREFLKGVRQRTLDPSTREFFVYLYTVKSPGGILYFHSPWEPATFIRTENGGEQYGTTNRLNEEVDLRKNLLMHSHPTHNPSGEGPSRMDVALASTYRKANGAFRYLYLVNNHLKLIRYKAIRPIDPGNIPALLAMPVKPRRGQHWLD
jgi:hypothetical protein